MIKRYLDYLKDNPQGYWFKRKLFGWGWTPATWQGWSVTATFAILVIMFTTTADTDSSPQELTFTFFLPLLLLTIAFLTIAYKKGEPPRWQWGFPKKDNQGQ